MMNPSATAQTENNLPTKGESMIQTAPPPAPVLSLWECLWSTMHREGWRMSHYTSIDEEAGGLRHLVRAHRRGDELMCSAPTMTLAMQVIFEEAKALSEPLAA